MKLLSHLFVAVVAASTVQAAVAAADKAPAVAAADKGPAAAPTQGHPPDALANPLQSAHGCLASGNGYLRAKIRGTLQLDINFHNAELDCDGGMRPDGSGLRVSFAGPKRSDGMRVRIVFGIVGAREGSGGHALATNVTVIFEGEGRIFATRGDDKCTADELQQERVGALAGRIRVYRVIARGFCIAPVNGVNNAQKIVISSFDFAGSVTFEDVAEH